MEILLDDEAHLDDLRTAFRVQVDEAGLRLDQLLSRRLGLAGRQVVGLAAEGRVRVQGRALLVGAPRLAAGTQVVVLGERARPWLLPERIPLAVLHEDREVFVIDKPAGLVMIPDRSHPAGTVANALRGLGRPLSGLEGPRRPGIVHRLDAGTSGAVLVAKHDEAHRRVAALFLAHDVTRRYLAVARGWPAWDARVIEAPLGRRHAGRKAQGVVPVEAGGRPARTSFRVERRFGRAGLELCLITAEPMTGRTHQIRAHLAALGHPLLGDTLYGGGSAASRLAARAGLRRPALHAERLAVPDLGLDVRADLPADLAALLLGAG